MNPYLLPQFGGGQAFPTQNQVPMEGQAHNPWFSGWPTQGNWSSQGQAMGWPGHNVPMVPGSGIMGNQGVFPGQANGGTFPGQANGGMFPGGMGSQSPQVPQGLASIGSGSIGSPQAMQQTQGLLGQFQGGSRGGGNLGQAFGAMTGRH